MSYWVLLYINPVAPLDCPWSISNSFNAQHGEWVYNSYFQGINNRFYGLLFLPFFYFIKGKYSIFILFEVIKVLYLLMIIVLLKNKLNPWVLLLLCLFFFLDKEVNIYREELFISLLMLLFYWYHHRYDSYFYQAIVFFLVLILIHPVAAVIHIIFYLTFEVNSIAKWNNHLTKEKIITSFMVLLLVSFYIFFTPVGLENISRGESRISSSQFNQLFFFVKMSFPFLAFLGIQSLRVRYQRPIYLIGLIAVLFFCYKFGGHYYFIYVFSYIILVLHRTELKKSNPIKDIIYLPILICSLFLTVIHPSIVYVESEGYLKTISHIFEEIEHVDCTPNSGNNIYISNHFAMPIIENENVRMTLNGVPHVQNPSQDIMIGDVIYLISKKELVQYQMSEYASRCKVSLMIPPTKGILSLSYLYNKRVNEFGLWKCEVIN